MPRKRQGEILAQKIFMCPVSLLQAIKDEAEKEGKSESEIIREALRVMLGQSKN
jgi:metal-responsive CopG/Arc/MetJ family transcriptional regulator